MMFLKWAAAIIIAFIVGKLVSKLKLPSILGWLITGIAVGFMIGTELVWKKIRSYGSALIVTTLVQSLGTFAVVSLVFSIVFVLVKQNCNTFPQNQAIRFCQGVRPLLNE